MRRVLDALNTAYGIAQNRRYKARVGYAPLEEKTMKGYLIIVNGALRDEPRFREARRVAAKALRKYGGRALVRSTLLEVDEGEWDPDHLLVVEFENIEAARDFLHSSEYKQIKTYREAQADVVMVVGAVNPAKKDSD